MTNTNQNRTRLAVVFPGIGYHVDKPLLFHARKLLREQSYEIINVDGSEYESHVNYWMPFNYSYGLHDATWRKNFGGEIYKTGGSHGCVNLPLNAAKFIFENSYAGIQVHVHD